jgi:hypothetical protein
LALFSSTMGGFQKELPMKKKGRVRQRKCRHCGQLYSPDPRTRDRQKHCSQPECKRASKAWRQRRWLSKPENKEYFSGPQSAARVKQWRAEHPGYRRKRPKTESALQDDCCAQSVDQQTDNARFNPLVLQDDCSLQNPLVVGLIASLTGSVLQDDIAVFIRRTHAYGQQILGLAPGMENGGCDEDQQTVTMPRAGSPGSRPVQLGGSSAGA